MVKKVKERLLMYISLVLLLLFYAFFVYQIYLGFVNGDYGSNNFSWVDTLKMWTAIGRGT